MTKGESCFRHLEGLFKFGSHAFGAACLRTCLIHEVCVMECLATFSVITESVGDRIHPQSLISLNAEEQSKGRRILKP